MRKERFCAVWLRREALCGLIRGWKDSCFPGPAVDSLFLTPRLYKRPFSKEKWIKACFLLGLRSQPSLGEISDHTLPLPAKKRTAWGIW